MHFASEDAATPRGRRWSAFLLVWAVLIVTRWEVLASPPYWDAGLSIWSEAEAILESRFNLWHHIVHEPALLLGGRAVYRFSFVPPLLASVQLLVPWPEGVLVAAHLVTLALGAWGAVCLCRLLSPRTGRVGATLTSACLLTTPLFSTQMDLIGSDLPPAACSLLAASCLARQRWSQAVSAGMLAFLLKPPGILVLAAVVGALTLRCLVEAARAGPRNPHGVPRALGGGIAGLGIAGLLTRIDQQAYGRFVGIHGERLAEIIDWCPELLALGSLCLIVAVVIGMSNLHSQPRLGSPERQDASSLDRPESTVLVMASLLVVATLGYCALTPALPRYAIYGIPVGWLLMGRVLFARPSWRPSATLLLLGLLAWNLANWNGTLIASTEALAHRQTGLPGIWFRGEGSFLERSRACLADHSATVEAMARVEATWDGYPVFAPHPYVHFLTIPRLGYVSRCLPTYKLTGGGDLSRGAQLAVWEALADPPPEPVFLVGRDLVTFYWNRLAVPQVEPGDEIIFDDPTGGPLVFRKRWGGRVPDVAERRRWLLARLWPHPVPRESLAHQPVRRARFRASRLAWIGERAAASAELRAALLRVPDDPALVELLGRVEAGAPVEPWSSW